MTSIRPPLTELNARRSTADWQAADAAHFLHPFTDFKALATQGSRIITRADGIWLEDSEGQRILDAMSGLWCVNLGYGQRELIDAATRQMTELPYYNSFFQTTTRPSVALAEALIEDFAPPGFSHVYFANSGSEGNDTVIRLVRRYWELAGQPQRSVIISRWNGYHGSTMGGASLSGMRYMHAQGGLPIPDIVHIGQPHRLEHNLERQAQGLTPLDEAEFGLLAASWLEDKIREIGPDRVAAFIGEPVQGAGGVIVPPPNYWPEIERICKRHNILLVSDEVICGFGRTGHNFGCQSWGLRPDLITFAKGVTSGYVPLGGVLVGEKVARLLIDQGGEFEHGYTYSGHPVACAVGLANLRLMQQLDVVNTVRESLAPQLALGFEALRDHPLVGDVQSHGLMAALQLVRRKADEAQPLPELFDPRLAVGMVCRAHCFGNGLIMRAVGDRMIVAPPLVMTPEDIALLLDRIRHCLDLTLAELQQRGLV
jgi:putrescine aminotransferase